VGLDIWFREDVARALLAAEQASATTVAAMEHALNGAEGAMAGDPRYLQAYREGYKAALVTVATAFGLKPLGNNPSIGSECSPAFLQSSSGRFLSDDY
jgi:hypothetical protein